MHLENLLIVFGMGAAPVLEPRAAIPYGIFILDLPPFSAAMAAFLGSLVPVLFVTPLVYWCGHALMQRWTLFRRILKRIHWHHGPRLERAYHIGLMVIAGLPIPFIGGVWTAIAAGFMVKVAMRHTILFTALGSLLGSILVAGLSVGFVNFF